MNAAYPGWATASRFQLRSKQRHGWNNLQPTHSTACNCVQKSRSFRQRTRCFLRLETNVIQHKLCGKPHNMPTCVPHAAAQLQPIHDLHLRRPARLAPWIFMINRQWLDLGGSVEYGVVHIIYVVTWTANQSGLVTLTFDLESGIRTTCDLGSLCANFSLPRPLCSQLRPDVCDRQTDVRQHHCLMPPPIRGGHNKMRPLTVVQSVITKTQIRPRPRVKWEFFGAQGQFIHSSSKTG